MIVFQLDAAVSNQKSNGTKQHQRDFSLFAPDWLEIDFRQTPPTVTTNQPTMSQQKVSAAATCASCWNVTQSSPGIFPGLFNVALTPPFTHSLSRSLTHSQSLWTTEEVSGNPCGQTDNMMNLVNTTLASLYHIDKASA